VTTIEEPTRSRAAPSEVAPPPVSAGQRGERRAELAAFLRARRSRIRPADVGLPPGFRRRTPGLRREEVAQLAAVGVTWYTWLEQGRPIHVSAQVLTAIARTLRLDEAEREHLFRLAEMPTMPPAVDDPAVPGEVLEILTALEPLPATLLNSRYDVLAANAGYEALFRGWHTVPCERHNILWCCFVEPTARQRFLNMDEQMPRLVGTLRASFAHHLGEPAWTGFIRRLSLASPEFARLWARHDVARPATAIKQIRHPDAGVLTMRSTSLAVAGMPEARIVTYTPADDHTRAWLPHALD
jgi:MmyB-like transcription regulator ligand binding domain/Helix-turn-helix domain